MGPEVLIGALTLRAEGLQQVPGGVEAADLVVPIVAYQDRAVSSGGGAPRVHAGVAGLTDGVGVRGRHERRQRRVLWQQEGEQQRDET